MWTDLLEEEEPTAKGGLTHVGEQTGDGLDISSGVNVAQLTDHRQTQSVNSDPPLPWNHSNVQRMEAFIQNYVLFKQISLKKLIKCHDNFIH